MKNEAPLVVAQLLPLSASQTDNGSTVCVVVLVNGAATGEPDVL
jgi:hypothetical protein